MVAIAAAVKCPTRCPSPHAYVGHSVGRSKSRLARLSSQRLARLRTAKRTALLGIYCPISLAILVREMSFEVSQYTRLRTTGRATLLGQFRAVTKPAPLKSWYAWQYSTLRAIAAVQARFFHARGVKEP